MPDRNPSKLPPPDAIVLDGPGLRAGWRPEWEKAYRLARRIAHRYVDRVGGEIDDLVQEALARLAAEIDALAAKGVDPAAALFRTFYCRAMKEYRRRHHDRALVQRLPGEPAIRPSLPDDEYAERQLADAIDRILQDELAAADAVDRAILEGVLAGLTNRAIARQIGRAEATVSERLKAIIQRLRRRLRALQGDRLHD